MEVSTLCAGNLNQYYYPHRYRLMRLGVKVFRKRGWKVTVLPHPGYTLPPREGTVVGEDFARMLNRAKIAFTCSMRYNYALAKYAEIAACRTLPAGDIPGERQEFFRDALLSLEPWMTDDEIVRTVEDVLDDPAELRRRTERAYELTLQTSTMDHYAERFHAAATALLTKLGKPT